MTDIEALATAICESRNHAVPFKNYEKPFQRIMLKDAVKVRAILMGLGYQLVPIQIDKPKKS